MIKSPLNYNSGKYKLLPQILPLIPDDINTFIDLFCGGLNVGINVKANKIVANDRLEPLMNIFKGMKENGSKESLKMVENQIEKYHLNKTNREGFNEIRAYYNSGHKDWNIFYAMVVHAYNYQMEFNKSGGYNVPLGTNRSWFNPTLKKNFIKFTEELDKKDIEFSNIDFREFDIESLKENDFVYLDPPYLIGYASYNKQKAWTEQDDKDLFDFCDKLNSKGIRFAMSNVFKNKGLENKQLINWSKKYKVHYLNANYKNCSQQRYDKVSETVEVLITNY